MSTGLYARLQPLFCIAFLGMEVRRSVDTEATLRKHPGTGIHVGVNDQVKDLGTLQTKNVGTRA